MCVICNVPQDAAELASDFLAHYERAQADMHKAADAMLAISKVAYAPELRRQYDRHHKAMVRHIRAWNQLEHERERHERATEDLG